MANHRAIAATSNALAGLIRDRYPRAEFGSELEIRLYQTRDFESPMQDGFSVYLYRVAISGVIRNMTLRRSADGAASGPPCRWTCSTWSRPGRPTSSGGTAARLGHADDGRHRRTERRPSPPLSSGD
jgi:hypothetical protein